MDLTEESNSVEPPHELCENEPMIQRIQFWLTLAGVCFTILAHNAWSQSGAANWEVQKLADEVPTAVFDTGSISGQAQVTMSDIRVIDA